MGQRTSSIYFCSANNWSDRAQRDLGVTLCLEGTKPRSRTVTFKWFLYERARMA